MQTEKNDSWKPHFALRAVMAEGLRRGNAAELQHMHEKCPTAPFYWISGAWAGGTWAQCSHRGAQPHQVDIFN